jgi:hypothetical protein
MLLLRALVCMSDIDMERSAVGVVGLEGSLPLMTLSSDATADSAGTIGRDGEPTDEVLLVFFAGLCMIPGGGISFRRRMLSIASESLSSVPEPRRGVSELLSSPESDEFVLFGLPEIHTEPDVRKLNAEQATY